MATNSKNSVSTGNTSSWFSVKSAKSAVEQIPKTRACPWVAQWFTIPQAILKPVQMVSSLPLFSSILTNFSLDIKALGITSVVLMLLWESEDITISSLNKGTINFRNELHGFVGISLLSALYSIGMAVLGISGLHIPPSLVIFYPYNYS